MLKILSSDKVFMFNQFARHEDAFRDWRRDAAAVNTVSQSTKTMRRQSLGEHPESVFGVGLPPGSRAALLSRFA